VFGWALDSERGGLVFSRGEAAGCGSSHTVIPRSGTSTPNQVPSSLSSTLTQGLLPWGSPLLRDSLAYSRPLFPHTQHPTPTKMISPPWARSASLPPFIPQQVQQASGQLSDDHKNKIMDTVIALNIFLDVPKPFTWIVHVSTASESCRLTSAQFDVDSSHSSLLSHRQSSDHLSVGFQESSAPLFVASPAGFMLQYCVWCGCGRHLCRCRCICSSTLVLPVPVNLCTCFQPVLSTCVKLNFQNLWNCASVWNGICSELVAAAAAAVVSCTAGPFRHE